MVARWFPEAINLKPVVTKRDKSTYEKNINNDIAVEAMKTIGASVVNVSTSPFAPRSTDLIVCRSEGRTLLKNRKHFALAFFGKS